MWNKISYQKVLSAHENSCLSNTVWLLIKKMFILSLSAVENPLRYPEKELTDCPIKRSQMQKEQLNMGTDSS